MFARSFADEEEDDSRPERGSAGEQQPDYVFEGFDVEFSEKIALTPAAIGRGAQEKG